MLGEGDVSKVRRCSHVLVLLTALHRAAGADDVILELGPGVQKVVKLKETEMSAHLAQRLSGAGSSVSASDLRLQEAAWR